MQTPRNFRFKCFKFCVCVTMAVSRFDAATRALVSVLLLLARSYAVVLEVNRESRPEQVLKAYPKLPLGSRFQVAA